MNLSQIWLLGLNFRRYPRANPLDERPDWEGGKGWRFVKLWIYLICFLLVYQVSRCKNFICRKGKYIWLLVFYCFKYATMFVQNMKQWKVWINIYIKNKDLKNVLSIYFSRKTASKLDSLTRKWQNCFIKLILLFPKISSI